MNRLLLSLALIAALPLCGMEEEPKPTSDSQETTQRILAAMLERPRKQRLMTSRSDSSYKIYFPKGFFCIGSKKDFLEHCSNAIEKFNTLYANDKNEIFSDNRELFRDRLPVQYGNDPKFFYSEIKLENCNGEKITTHFIEIDSTEKIHCSISAFRTALKLKGIVAFVKIDPSVIRQLKEYVDFQKHADLIIE